MIASSCAASGAMPNRAEADAVGASVDANSATPIITLRFISLPPDRRICDFCNKFPLCGLFRPSAIDCRFFPPGIQGRHYHPAGSKVRKPPAS
jgi:hypothetical protein